MMENCPPNSSSTTSTQETLSSIINPSIDVGVGNRNGNSNGGNHEVGVKTEELVDLLDYFSKTTYKARDTQPKVQFIMEKCLDLFGLDYKYSVIPNTSGDLSTNYPSILVVLEEEKEMKQNLWSNSHRKYQYLSTSLLDGNYSPTHNKSNGSIININGKSCNGISSMNIEKCSTSPNLKDTSKVQQQQQPQLDSSSLNGNSCQDERLELTKMKDLCSKARFARCRARFPIPVILYNKKHICRSATLSGGPEIYGRSSFDYFFSGGTDSRFDCVSDEEMVLEAQSEWQLFDRVRSQDIRLLKAFKVHTIIDLMVEKKKVKFGVNVTSSEKVDKENRYADFNIVSLPYPGCEFFKQYRDNAYNGEQLVFEWNQGHDANICVPSDPTAASLNLNWSQYRNWDLILLTQNYLKLLLAYLHEGQKGILVHCISGWDRTPLFISLLRLSLWADGVIHKSLDADQILYLTLAYDWLLFGHNLEDRLSKGEEILFFCFNFLKYMVEPEYSVEEIRNLSKQYKISKVKSDSDIHLEGVLLDGSVTSPEGSNWSLNSCDSSQSSKSLSENNPPSYFQVTQQDSFEDCSGIPPLIQNGRNGSFTSSAQNFAQIPILRTCANSTSCLITNSMINSVTTLNGSLESNIKMNAHNNATTINSQTSVIVTNNISNNTLLECSSSAKNSNGIYENKILLGRTSPVPVPNLRHNQTRLDSDSSASIGSWQLITGSGSLREMISASDPRSNLPHHSHPLRVPLSELDFIEPSESSCTLIEELTPIQTNQSLCLFSSMKPSESNNINNDIIRSTIEGNLISFEECSSNGVDEPIESKENNLDDDELKYEIELGLALDESFERKLEDDDIDNLFSAKPIAHLTLDEPITLTSTPTDDDETTPTLEHENNNHIIIMMSKRKEKLETVRVKFYDLYSRTIGFQCRNVNDNGSFGSIIGNFATKVGIRSATHSRVNHV